VRRNTSEDRLGRMDSMATTVRIGLVGAGPWARLVHAPAMAAHPATAFAGVWSRRPGAAAALAREHGTRVYSTFDDLLADVDAVGFAVPPQVQAQHAIRAARAGRHLVCEKPLAGALDAAHQVADAADRAASSARWSCGCASRRRWRHGSPGFLGRMDLTPSAPLAGSPDRCWVGRTPRRRGGSTRAPFSTWGRMLDAAAPLWDPHGRAGALVAGVGDGIDVGGVKSVEDAVFAPRRCRAGLSCSQTTGRPAHEGPGSLERHQRSPRATHRGVPLGHVLGSAGQPRSR
jgi:Oxidoreductase family, NAD-binding Rossmann fold